MKLPPAVRRTPRFLTSAEFDKLRVQLAEPYRTMVTVAAFTGLRWGELVGLHGHRVDVARRRLVVVETLQEVSGVISVKPYPKSSTSHRAVPLALEVIRALEAHGVRDGLLFTTPTGTPLSRGNVANRGWLPAVKAAGLADPQPRWHDLRHTCASWLVQDGVPIYEVQRMLGHSSVAVTERYSHLVPGAFDRILAALDH